MNVNLSFHVLPRHSITPLDLNDKTPYFDHKQPFHYDTECCYAQCGIAVHIDLHDPVFVFPLCPQHLKRMRRFGGLALKIKQNRCFFTMLPKLKRPKGIFGIPRLSFADIDSWNRVVKDTMLDYEWTKAVRMATKMDYLRSLFWIYDTMPLQSSFYDSFRVACFSPLWKQMETFHYKQWEDATEYMQQNYVDLKEEVKSCTISKGEPVFEDELKILPEVLEDIVLGYVHDLDAYEMFLQRWSNHNIATHALHKNPLFTAIPILVLNWKRIVPHIDFLNMCLNNTADEHNTEHFDMDDENYYINTVEYAYRMYCTLVKEKMNMNLL